MIEDNEEAQKSKLRCFFYLLSLLCKNEVDRDDGFVWLNAVITPHVKEIWHQFVIQSVEIVDCFPIRLKVAHLLICPPKSGKKKMVKSVVGFTKAVFEEKFGARAISTTVETVPDLTFELAKLGFGERSLPRAFGGTWSYENYCTSMKRQCQEEKTRWDASVADSPALVVAFAAGAEMARQQPSGAEIKQHKRKLNVIHSRLKRERRRADLTRLEDQCSEIVAANSILRADNDQLEILLKEANAMVSDHVD